MSRASIRLVALLLVGLLPSGAGAEPREAEDAAAVSDEKPSPTPTPAAVPASTILPTLDLSNTGVPADPAAAHAAPSPPPEGAPSPPPEPAPEAAPPSPPDPAPPKRPRTLPPRSPFTPEDSWLDASHAFVEQRLFAPVLRLDRFFSDERELEAERSRSFVRFRNEVTFSQDGDPVFSSTVRASLRFPGFSRWLDGLRLDLAGEADDTPSALFPSADAPAGPVGPARAGRANAELRYGVWRGVLARVDLGAGLLFQLPIGAFARARYRLALPVDGWFLTRYSQSVFWRTDTRLGTATQLEVERPLGAVTLARAWGRGELTQESRHVEWGTQLALLRALGPARAVAVGAGMQGVTGAPVAVDKYRLFTRYRRDVWRRWIFAEVEPEIGWPWNATEGRHRAYAVALRLELQFQGKEARPATAEPSEPADPPLRAVGARP